MAYVTWPYQVLGNVRAEAVRRNVAGCHTGNPASCGSGSIKNHFREMEEGSEALHIPSLFRHYAELPSNLQLFRVLRH